MLQETTDRLLKLLTQSCMNHYGSDLVSIVVYGSVARGTHTYSSDIDILLIAHDLPRGRLNRMRDFSRIEKQLVQELQAATDKGWNVDLSPVIRTPDEVRGGGYLYLDMVDDALILYDKENFFYEYLKDLRKQGIEPPKLHDVGPPVIEHKTKFLAEQQQDVERVAEISKWLRKEREFAFYGDIDLIPTEEYTEEDAARAKADAEFVVS